MVTSQRMPPRRDVRIDSGMGQLAGWLYPPAGRTTGRWPCVVLAHGFAMTRAGGLSRYAERFAAAGIGVLVFDYRHFGDSTGQPRQLLDVGRQLADWRAAIVWTRAQSEVDESRIALWGTSFSGGHVLVLAAADSRLAATVAQVPFADGLSLLRPKNPSAHGRTLALAAVRDELRARIGRAPVHVAPLGEPGELAMMTAADAVGAIRRLYPQGADFVNAVCARILLRLPFYRPVRRAGEIRCPLLVQLADRDTITAPGPAATAAAAAPSGRLRCYPGDHLDAYGALFEPMITDQLDFLCRHLNTG
ncbi:MAG: alpha/beta hydrolase [Sciscionella sp.]